MQVSPPCLQGCDRPEPKGNIRMCLRKCPLTGVQASRLLSGQGSSDGDALFAVGFAVRTQLRLLETGSCQLNRREHAPLCLEGRAADCCHLGGGGRVKISPWRVSRQLRALPKPVAFYLLVPGRERPAVSGLGEPVSGWH